MADNEVEYVVKIAGIPTVTTFSERDIPYPEQFLSPEEIALDIYENRMSLIDFEQLCKMKREELISLHLNMGMWLRNSYGLWMDNNPHTSLEDSRSDRFPDQVSQYIIEKLHECGQPNNIYGNDVKENIKRSFRDE